MLFGSTEPILKNYATSSPDWWDMTMQEIAKSSLKAQTSPDHVVGAWRCQWTDSLFHDFWPTGLVILDAAANA